MDILEVINELEEVIEESTRVPLLGKVLIDDDLMMEYVDRIRSALPEEIRQAKLINREREKILTEAQAEAKKMMDNARLEINKMAGENEITKEAQKQAEDLYNRARKTAQDIRNGANDYADDILKKLEDNLQKALIVVKNGREELKPKVQAKTAAAKETAAANEKQ